jgi:hypothetical protein
VQLELLEELGRDHMIRTAIEAAVRRYVARLTPELLAAAGGDRIAPAPLRAIGGDR